LSNSGPPNPFVISAPYVVVYANLRILGTLNLWELAALNVANLRDLIPVAMSIVRYWSEEMTCVRL
ncbi:hypothetical protein J6590_050037, partial [Homalodisca vitripennis]